MSEVLLLQAITLYRICNKKLHCRAQKLNSMFRGWMMITSQQLALMTAWCPVASWLTRDPHFSKGCNKGHYSVSVGSGSKEDGMMKGTHWSVGCRWDRSFKHTITGRCSNKEWLKTFWGTQILILFLFQMLCQFQLFTETISKLFTICILMQETKM